LGAGRGPVRTDPNCASHMGLHWQAPASERPATLPMGLHGRLCRAGNWSSFQSLCRRSQHVRDVGSSAGIRGICWTWATASRRACAGQRGLAQVTRFGNSEGIQLCFLPAYSPELQPAERIWPLINEVVANRAYKSLEELEVVVGNRMEQLEGQSAVIKAHCHYHWWSGARCGLPGGN